MDRHIVEIIPTDGEAARGRKPERYQYPTYEAALEQVRYLRGEQRIPKHRLILYKLIPVLTEYTGEPARGD